MAIRKIFTNDAPCLRKVARPVKNFDAHLATLLDDMKETMYKAEGVGLAAPQIGVLKRVCVIDCRDDIGYIELVNPRIVAYSGEQEGPEGCLSFPGRRGWVVRPNSVIVRGFDRFGNEVEYKGNELFARAVFHETDHLDGKVYIDIATEIPDNYEEDEV